MLQELQLINQEHNYMNRSFGFFLVGTFLLLHQFPTREILGPTIPEQ